MRFVAIKNPEQQAVLMLHRIRELLMRKRTMPVNALRGHLAEYGIITPKDCLASPNVGKWPRGSLSGAGVALHPFDYRAT